METWMIIVLVVISIITLLIIIRLYANSPTTSLNKDLTNNVVIVTGASAGIGKVTAIELLKRGATVIFACRNEAKALSVINSLDENMLRERAVFMKLDLSSFESVKKFTEEFGQYYHNLHILVNNAGLINEEYLITKDNLEHTIQTNHTSVCYLTALLFPTIHRSQGKVVSLGSEAHKYTIDFKMEDWMDSLETGNHETLKKEYNNMGFGFYGLSKLGNNYMSKYFGDKAKLYSEYRGSQYIVPFVTVHPGTVYTSFLKCSGSFLSCLMVVFIFPFQLLLFKSEFVGAQTTLHCCYMDNNDLLQGGYYKDCSLGKESDKSKNKLFRDEFMTYTFNCIRKKCPSDTFELEL